MTRMPLCSCVLVLMFGCMTASGQHLVVQLYDAHAVLTESENLASVGGVDVLSDTGGVDVGPYIKQIVGTIYKNWLPLIPQEARPPQSSKGEALIRFRILPDGRIGNMWLDGSTHDDAINRACWGAIAAAQFPALPTALGSKPLDLRLHFYVNVKPQ